MVALNQQDTLSFDRKLAKAARRSFRSLETFRNFRRVATKQMVGAHYGNRGADLPVPVNMVELLTSVMVQQLAARNPQVDVSTVQREFVPTSVKLALGVNETIKKMNLANTIRRVVQDAMFSLGIAVTELSETDPKGNMVQGGFPRIRSASIEHWIHDTNARELEDMRFAGHRYQMKKKVARQLKLNHEQELALDNSDDRFAERIQRLESMNLPDDVNLDDFDIFDEDVDAWDIWIPQESEIRTYLAGDTDDDAFFKGVKPIRVRPWYGPSLGPYNLLGFTTVPDNFMPLAPVMVTFDLALYANKLYRKIQRQAQDQKTVFGYDGQSVDDASKIYFSPDMEMVNLNHPDGVKEHKFGGMDPQTFAFTLNTLDEFKARSGNLDLLAGLGPQSDTASQDEQLGQNAGVKTDDMRDKVLEFAKDIVTNIAWFTFDNPFLDIPITQTVQGTSRQFGSRLTHEDLRGDFIDYNFRIEPFSMQHRSPAMKQAAMERMLGVFTPFIQGMQQQGVNFDWQKYIRTWAKHADQEELQNAFIFTTPLPPQENSGSTESSRSAVTKHINERVNRNASTPQSQSNQMIQSLLNQGQNSGSSGRAA